MPESPQTLNQVLIEAMDRFGAQTCLFVKQNRLYQSISYRFFRGSRFGWPSTCNSAASSPVTGWR